MAVILDFGVKMMSKCQNDVRITILMVNLPQKVYSYIILGALVKMILFQDGAGGHFGFGKRMSRNWGPGPDYHIAAPGRERYNAGKKQWQQELFQPCLFLLLANNSDFHIHNTQPHYDLNWLNWAGRCRSIWVPTCSITETSSFQTFHSRSLILLFHCAIVVQTNHCSIKISLYTAYGKVWLLVSIRCLFNKQCWKSYFRHCLSPAFLASVLQSRGVTAGRHLLNTRGPGAIVFENKTQIGS